MTSNQINYYKAKEEARNNRVTEAQGWFQRATEMYNAHTQRRKTLFDYELGSRQARASEYQAEASMANAATNARNAAINAQNAATREYEASIAYMNAKTNRYNADINKQNADTRMLELEEQQRHNIETEQLGYDTLQETSRHNEATEQLDLFKANETARHNRADEMLEESNIQAQRDRNYNESKIHYNTLQETIRHNQYMEGLSVADTTVGLLAQLLNIGTRLVR